MANTRTSAKRARQATRRQERNRITLGNARKAVKRAVESLGQKDEKVTLQAYRTAIQALGKASSKGVLPARQASRKASKLTHQVKAKNPSLFAS